MDTRELIRSQLQTSAAGMQSVITKDLTAEEAAAQPHGLAPIVWQAGHIAYYEALLVAQVEENAPDVPDNYEALFAQGSTAKGEFPPFEEVVATLQRSQSALLRLVERDLSTSLAGEPLYTSLAGALLFTHYHRGYHMGKIMTLRGLLGKDILF